MTEHKKKHIVYYSVSVIILLTSLVLIALYRHDNNLQARCILIATSCYFAWSLLHHYVHHDLNAKIVIEYMLVASIGVVLSLFLFNS